MRFLGACRDALQLLMMAKFRELSITEDACSIELTLQSGADAANLLEIIGRLHIGLGFFKRVIRSCCRSYRRKYIIRCAGT